MVSLLKRRWLLAAIAAMVTMLWAVSAFSTAQKPPALTRMSVNGKTENILFITRAGDTVLVRCYPGFAPTLTVGKKQSNISTTGYLKCQPEK